MESVKLRIERVKTSGDICSLQQRTSSLLLSPMSTNFSIFLALGNLREAVLLGVLGELSERLFGL